MVLMEEYKRERRLGGYNRYIYHNRYIYLSYISGNRNGLIIFEGKVINMLWWTLPLFLIVAVIADYTLSKGKPAIVGTLEQKLFILLVAPIIAPIIEELAFRWMPLQWFGLYGMIGFTIAWALFHFKIRYLPFYALMGTYFCYLWYIDMGWLAILAHILWNTINSIFIIYRKPELANWNFRNPSLAKVAWNSKEIGMYRSWIWKIKSLIQN